MKPCLYETYTVGIILLRHSSEYFNYTSNLIEILSAMPVLIYFCYLCVFIGLGIEEEASEVLRLEHSIIWC